MKGLKRLKGLKGRVGKWENGGKEGRTTQDTRRKEEVVFIRIPSCLSAEASAKAEEGLGVGQKRRRTHDAG